jgi:hypothetical protein
MIVTKNFTFIHTSRTGGSFATHIIKNFFPDFIELEYHLPISKYQGKGPFVGTIRNPFDWYVSAFHFYRAIGHPLMHGVQGFDEGLRLMLGIKGTEKQRYLINYDWSKFPLPNLTSQDFFEYPPAMGYYSWLVDRMTGTDTHKVRFMRFESLREDLICVFNSYGTLSEHQESLIRETPNINGTPRGAYREYYTKELIGLVYEADKYILNKFGYEF